MQVWCEYILQFKQVAAKFLELLLFRTRETSSKNSTMSLMNSPARRINICPSTSALIAVVESTNMVTADMNR